MEPPTWWPATCVFWGRKHSWTDGLAPRYTVLQPGSHCHTKMIPHVAELILGLVRPDVVGKKNLLRLGAKRGIGNLHFTSKEVGEGVSGVDSSPTLDGESSSARASIQTQVITCGRESIMRMTISDRSSGKTSRRGRCKSHIRSG